MKCVSVRQSPKTKLWRFSIVRKTLGFKSGTDFNSSYIYNTPEEAENAGWQMIQDDNKDDTASEIGDG